MAKAVEQVANVVGIGGGVGFFVKQLPQPRGYWPREKLMKV